MSHSCGFVSRHHLVTCGSLHEWTFRSPTSRSSARFLVVPTVLTANVAGVNDSYLRFPHLHGELVTFVAEDDVWLAPLGGGRAWRVSADQATVRSPRFSPDGAQLA